MLHQGGHDDSVRKQTSANRIGLVRVSTSEVATSTLTSRRAFPLVCEGMKSASLPFEREDQTLKSGSALWIRQGGVSFQHFVLSI